MNKVFYHQIVVHQEEYALVNLKTSQETNAQSALKIVLVFPIVQVSSPNQLQVAL